MSLTNAEQRQLEEIERGLMTEAPRLAALLAPAGMRDRTRFRRSGRWAGTVLLIVGIAVVVAGVGARVPAVAAAGLITAVLGPVMVRAGTLLRERHERQPH